jgi:hypothetical protein
MSNNNNCLPTFSYKFINCNLYVVFRFCIESRGGFIEKKDLWFSNESSSNGDTLLLSSTEFYSSLSNNGIVAFWHNSLVFDERKCVGFLAGFVHHFVSDRINVKAVADVGFDSSREEDWFLLHHGNLAMIPSWVKIFDVLSTE